MKILVITNQIDSQASPDDQDTLVQASHVCQALEDLGHVVQQGTFTDREQFNHLLSLYAPDFIFNLVELVSGSFANAYQFIEILETLKIPFSGAGSCALRESSNKLSAKHRLVEAGIPTPACFEADSPHAEFAANTLYIIKPVSECGSLFIDSQSVASFTDCQQLRQLLQNKQARFQRRFFAEQYLAGSELYVSLLQKEAGVAVLPIAELKLEKLDDNPFRILRYKDKWLPASEDFFEKHRLFHSAESEISYVQQIKEIALRCWDIFKLGSAARIDFRLDQDKKPHVLEINANPALTPGTGFVRAALEAGISYQNLINQLIKVNFKILS